MRLDEAVSAHCALVDNVLIKIDVEGHERAILAGGPATLQRCRACIIEFHTQPIFDEQLSLDEACVALRQFGLVYGGVLQQALRRGRLNYFDAIFVNWTH